MQFTTKVSNRVFTLMASLLVAGAPMYGNLVLNPGFETGNFTDWTLIHASSGSSVGVGTADPHSGSYAAGFGSLVVGNYDSIQQAIPTATGSEYQLTFWLALFTGGSNSNDFQVFWDNTLILDISSASNFSYTEYTVSALAGSAGSTTELQFQGYNPPGGFYLDDISLEQVSSTGPVVPEPSWSILSTLLAVVFAGMARRVNRKSAS